MKYSHSLLLTLLWNAAEASVVRGASSTSASALVQDRLAFESRSHAQLSRWCNATIPAQGSRRSALQSLLQAAQSTSEATSEASDGGSLAQLQSAAASLGGKLERGRLQIQASQSMKVKELASLKLDLADSTRDVEALQRAYDHLGGAKVQAKSHMNAGQQETAKLLAQAKEKKAAAQEKVSAAASKSTDKTDLSKLELQYRGKKADIVAFQHQYYTTQRSLDVLTSALEDESGYLSDLQSICGAETRVHERLESHVLPILRTAPALAAEGTAPKPKVALAEAAAPEVVQAEATPQKAVSVKPAAKAVAAKVPHKKAVVAQAVHKKAVVAKVVHKTSTLKRKPTAVKPVHHKAHNVHKPKAVKPVAHKAVASKIAKAKPAAVKPVVHKTKKAHKHPHKNVKVQPALHKTKKHHAKKALAHLKGHHTATKKVAAAVHKKVHHAAPKKVVPVAHKKVQHAAPKKVRPHVVKAAPMAAPKTKDPFADDDDDDDAPAPKQVAAVVAKPAVHKKHVAKAAPKAAPKMKDPFADDDDDDDALAPKPVAAVVAKPAAHKKPISKPTPKAAPKMKDPFADDDDDDDAPVAKHVAAVVAKPVAHKKRVAQAKTPPPAPKMKDPFADDDDDDAPAPPPAPKHKPHKRAAAKMHSKKAPAKNAFLDSMYDSAAGNMPSTYGVWKPDGASAASAPAATEVEKPTTAAQAKNQMLAMLGSDDDDDDVTAPKAAAARPRAVKHMAAARAVPAPTAQKEDAAKAAGVKAAEAAFDADDDAAPAAVTPSDFVAAPKPVAKTALAQDDSAEVSRKAAEATKKAAEAAFDSDDDTFDAKAAFDAAKPPLAKKAVQDDLDGDEAIDNAFPAKSTMSQIQVPKSHKKSAAHKSAKKDASFLDGVYDAAAGNLPNQYAAWSPTEKASSDQKKKAALAQMEAEFDDDDDDAPKPVPKKRAKKHHHHAARMSAPAPPPRPQPASDGVVYDDDDLPRHHGNAMRGLEGGWQAFMKPAEKKKVSRPKLDPDVAIMESLYQRDGSLPSQYTAWTPDDAPKPVAAAPKARRQAAAGDDEGDAPMDLEAAAKEFAKDPDKAFDFFQVDSKSNDVVADLIHHAVHPSAHSFRAPIFLEASSFTVEKARLTAATTVLEQYAEVLKSKPLHQLAKAKLSPPKLLALYQQLRNVDPLVGKPVPTQGKQAQAEQMCKYFQEHMKSASPIQKAVSLVETASNKLAESVSRRAALLEEIDARTQLQRTMEQDMSSLNTLALLAKQGEDTSALEKLGKQLTGAAAMAVGSAAEGVEGGHAELKDLLDLAIQKRSQETKVQHAKLAQLQGQVKTADASLTQTKKNAAASQASMAKARKKLASITKSCDATLDALAVRRHAGHMEAHAIEVALIVLGTKK